jgi:SAM-dependent methyltransferase
LLNSGESCRVCTSRYTLYVQDVLGRRTQKKYPQWFCMDCQSFVHTSNYVEDLEQQRMDYEELQRQRDHHSALQYQLALELYTRRPHTRTVLEIGHGLGLFLRAARDFGREGTGFEVNPYCQEFAADELGLNSINGYFDETHPDKYDLIASNQVLEHLEDPRKLFRDMVDHLNPDGAIYAAVPFIERYQWPYLWTAGTNPADSAPDIFFDNDVHITHFSIEGLRRMGLSMGARTAEYFVSEDVDQHSPGAYQGVLFTF